MSNATDALRVVQEDLVQRGAVDVKFFFNPGVAGHALSDIKDSVARVLSAYCEGRVEAKPRVGDSHLVVAA